MDLAKKLVRQNNQMIEQIEELKMMIGIKSLSPWLTVEEAAAYTGYSKTYFYKIYEEIPHFQRDKRIMIRKDDLEAWMQKNKKTPTAIGAYH